MARTTHVAGDVDRDLRAVQAIVDDAPVYLDEWARLAVRDRESWAADWEYAIVGLVPALQETFRSGVMTPEQQRVFASIFEKVFALRPRLISIELASLPALKGK